MPAGIVTRGVILRALGGTMRKFTTCRPRVLPFRSLLVTACALLAAAAFLPQANAEFCPPGVDCAELQHFNFNNDLPGAAPPYMSVEGTTTLFNDPLEAFPAGNIVIADGHGTTDNGGGDLAGNALDLRGNTSGTGTNYCFNIGAINVSGLTEVSVSFALQSVGNGGQFTTLMLSWSTDGVSWTNFATFTDLQTHGTYFVYDGQFDTGGATSIYVQFCFTGSTNNAAGNHTYIDNIEINGVIPEPATVLGGMLGVLGLCWHQRRRLIRSVRFRRT